MQLDADLGIDSIKRVEILSAMQDRLPGLPALKPEQLGSFRTLRAIVDFIDQTLRNGQHDDNVRPADACAVEPSVNTAAVLLAVVADKTGYPAEMLELDMRLDTDLGIDSIKRVEIFSAHPRAAPREPGWRSPNRSGALGHCGNRRVSEFDGCRAGTEAGCGNCIPCDPTAHQVTRSRGFCSKPWPTRPAIPRNARARHATRYRSGHRLDQAGRDPLGGAGKAAGDKRDHPGATGLADFAAADRGGALGTSGTVSASREPARNGPPARGIVHTNGMVHHPAHDDGPSRNGEEKGTVSPRRAVVVRALHPVLRAVRAGETREQIALCAGGTVWVSSDGSPLTDAVHAALRKRDIASRVISSEDFPRLCQTTGSAA